MGRELVKAFFWGGIRVGNKGSFVAGRRWTPMNDVSLTDGDGGVASEPSDVGSVGRNQ